MRGRGKGRIGNWEGASLGRFGEVASHEGPAGKEKGGSGANEVQIGQWLRSYLGFRLPPLILTVLNRDYNRGGVGTIIPFTDCSGKREYPKV